MKKCFVIIFLAASLASTGCRNKEATGDLTVLDVENAIDNRRPFDLSEITKEFEFIALDDSSNESLLGDNLKVQESKKRFYVYDAPQKPIKTFDKTGKFVSTIGSIGRGPGELPFIGDIAVDYLKDNLYLGGGRSTIVAYDAEGKLFARNDSILWGETMVCSEDRLIVLKGDESKPDGKMTLLEIFSKELQRESGIDVLDKGSSIVVANSSEGPISYYLPSTVMSYNGNTLVLKETLNDTVFHYSAEKGLTPNYRFDFGSHSIRPGSTGPNPTTLWNDRFYAFNVIWEGEKYIVTHINNFSEEYCLIFDRRNPQKGFSALGPDNKAGLFLDGIQFTPSYIRDNRLVGWIRALDVTDNRDNITDPGLKALAATLREDSNPVLVVAKLKE